jgi:hypothetical protein
MHARAQCGQMQLIGWLITSAAPKHATHVALADVARAALRVQVKHNEETGDNIAPAVMTSGLDPAKRGLNFKTMVSISSPAGWI